ncbi:spermidine/putrescine ABC transporter ATP-binding protein [Variovorax sp. WS11]|nr:ABC transporter ATP-binding protein [Variovorax sp. WS11]NDZ18341.1 ABC transporter ATP-binding protein [Variovorax sp. WS11]PSL84356.1 spermidine/putrescine ABC transporter ATP-binding protein [Variovorax sp. WS11]
MSKAGDIAVRFEGVSKAYGGTTVLQPTELNVRRGEFLTLLGPSGSGKSTILNIIAGSTPPSSGRVFLDGEDVTQKPPRERGLGMVFQNYALMPHMSVYENVAFPLKIRNWKADAIRTQVMATLEKVGLSGFAQRKPKELSGGQQQRVSIARCLVYSPSIILMDEPLGALDKKLRDQLQGEIKSLHRDIGTTLIYVTHDQEEALNLSDKVCLMNQGRIEQLGTPSELYFDPANRFVADFVGESNILAGTLLEAGVLKTKAGTLLRVQSRHAHPGAQVEVLVRPENVRLLHPGEAASDDNVVEATVAGLSFVGGRTRVEAVAGAERLLATRISARNDAAIQPGEKVRLAWSPSNSIVLN